MIPSSSLHLLNQDNTIPGNRKDGFRYHHLRFIVVATPIYLWFELSFGVRLLDGISTNIAAGETDAIEHWGRIISGFAVALLFLSEWVRQAEKISIPWPARILVGIAICIACIAVTWWGQNKLIDFYVRRSTRDIALGLALLLVLVVAGLLVLRFWIRYSMQQPQGRYRRMVLGLVVILVVGYVLIRSISAVLPKNPERLGVERQRAATLTLVRKSIQQGHYGLRGVETDERLLGSPEGKAFLALFPVFGVVLDQERFARDRPLMLAETMYRDWDDQQGERAYAAFQDAVKRIRTRTLDDYLAASREHQSASRPLSREAAQQAWDKSIRVILNGEALAPGLSADAFLRDPAVNAALQKQTGCFDCKYDLAMDRRAFGREFHKWTQANNVKQAVEFFEASKNFEAGRDGERAARTYWVPIWALLFSMIGAFTHIFKMIFTITEYAHRLTFNKVKAADSALAELVIHNSRVVTAAVVLGMGMFIYFSDNRITAHDRYLEMRPQMWQYSPIVGGVAAHWTVNAQGFLYPFTRKIRPGWLVFDSDPLAFLPFKLPGISDDFED